MAYTYFMDYVTLPPPPGPLDWDSYIQQLKQIGFTMRQMLPTNELLVQAIHEYMDSDVFTTKQLKQYCSDVGYNYITINRRLQAFKSSRGKFDLSKAQATQQLEKTYVLNGALYFATRDFLMREHSFVNEKTIPYVMPIERSVDIDNYMDWKWAEFLVGE